MVLTYIQGNGISFLGLFLGGGEDVMGIGTVPIHRFECWEHERDPLIP